MPTLARRATMAAVLGAGLLALGTATAGAAGSSTSTGTGSATGAGSPAPTTATGPAQLDAGSGGATIAGFDVIADAIGAKFTFDIPYLFPLSGNLVSEAVPLAQSTAQSGPVIDALGAPYYPGQILAHFGTDLATFGAPPSASALNDPLLAESKYPPAPGERSSASFGGTPPKGAPITPDVISATTSATSSAAAVTAAVSDLRTGSPSTAPSSTFDTPSASTTRGGLAGASSSPPAFDMATTETTNAVHIASTSVRSSATSVVRSIDIAGVLDIAQVIGTATSTSNGTESTPTSSLHVGEVTVDGVPAYIDASGVHVDGKSPPVDGVTPGQAQQTLDHTFAQDGLSVRLLEPTTTTTTAGMATGDSGGIEVTESHAFAVPVVPGAPSIPIPGLGDESLPAGTYQAVTTITLGEAVAGVEASAVPPAFGLGGLSSLGGVPIAPSAPSGTGAGIFGGGSLSGTGSSPGFSTAAGNGLGFSTAPSSASESTAASGLGAGLAPPSGSRSALAASSGPFGIPVPFGWAVAALLASLLGAYGMLLAARWQFLGRRSR